MFKNPSYFPVYVVGKPAYIFLYDEFILSEIEPEWWLKHWFNLDKLPEGLVIPTDVAS